MALRRHALGPKADREVPRISHLLPPNRHLLVRSIHLMVPADHLPTPARVGKRGADTGPPPTAGRTYSARVRTRPADLIEVRRLTLAALAAANDDEITEQLALMQLSGVKPGRALLELAADLFLLTGATRANPSTSTTSPNGTSPSGPSEATPPARSDATPSPPRC